jgi:predicted ABC-type exoprotein transport system permease subunit
MSRIRLPLVVLLALQVIACLIYPPAYFLRAPQAAVMPAALMVLFILAIVGINTGTLSMEGTRSLLIFIQGINLVIRLMSLFPNLISRDGSWAWGLLITQIIALALSWYTMVAMEHRSLEPLRFRRHRESPTS